MSDRVPVFTANALLAGLQYLGRKQGFTVAIVCNPDVEFGIELCEPGILVERISGADNAWQLRVTGHAQDCYPCNPEHWILTKQFFNHAWGVEATLLNVVGLLAILEHWTTLNLDGLLGTATRAEHMFGGF